MPVSAINRDNGSSPSPKGEAGLAALLLCPSRPCNSAASLVGGTGASGGLGRAEDDVRMQRMPVQARSYYSTSVIDKEDSRSLGALSAGLYADWERSRTNQQSLEWAGNSCWTCGMGSLGRRHACVGNGICVFGLAKRQ